MKALIMTVATAMLASQMTLAQGGEAVPRVAPPAAYEVSPPLAAYADKALFGDNWRRTQISARDRSMVTLATLIANNRSAQLRGHLSRALDNGVTPLEISEIVAHLAFYAGWPVAISAVPVAKEVFDARGIGAMAALPGEEPPLALEPEAERQRRATVDSLVGDIAPGLAAFTNDALFGDLWRRPGLAPRDRSLVTVVALIVNGQAEQMPFHLNRAMDAGMTAEQLAEVVTHVAFYAGWPRAMSAVPALEKTLAARAGAAQPAEAPQGLTIRRHTENPPAALPAANFTGTAHLASRFQVGQEGDVGGGAVTFQPGARTHWHTHPRGQTLIVLSGEGWVQVEGGPVESMRPGDVVVIPPGARHWHGATAGSAMSHVAIAEAEGEGERSTTWLHPVTEAEYRADG